MYGLERTLCKNDKIFKRSGIERGLLPHLVAAFLGAYLIKLSFATGSSSAAVVSFDPPIEMLFPF
mgnify:CR=1 FL=1